MSTMANTPSLSHLMRASTQALYECQQSMGKNTEVGKTAKLGIDQTNLLLRLMETLVDTKNQLVNDIESDRFIYIDPAIANEMEVAIAMAMVPLDDKVNQIYFSIFGYNSALWQVLRDVQKLLQTVEILKDPSAKRVTKVTKKNRERRKKRHEKDVLIPGEKEEQI